MLILKLLIEFLAVTALILAALEFVAYSLYIIYLLFLVFIVFPIKIIKKRSVKKAYREIMGNREQLILF